MFLDTVSVRAIGPVYARRTHKLVTSFAVVYVGDWYGAEVALTI
jgi:hypothetical protein